MKITYPALIRLWRGLTLMLLFVLAAAQTFSQISQYPQNRQLYPRNLKTNKATIPIAGSIDASSGYKSLLLKKYRNGVEIEKRSIILLYWNRKASFKINEDIKAELANYKFELYGVNGQSQTLLQSADQVVAGDAIIIQGQSNAVANLRGGYSPENDANSATNAPNRSFVRVYGNGSSSYNFTPQWFIAEGNIWYENDGHAGQWGLRLGSNLAGELKIPIAIFNGAHPGQPIRFFQRNDADPDDRATNYGRLLSRVNEAGFHKNIRAIIWHQGESDALGTLSPIQLSTDQYKEAFLSLYDDWKKDYPGLDKLVVFQIRYGCGMASVNGALEIQEAQRQLADEKKDILVMSSNATQQLFEGGTINYCHYQFQNGYALFGNWISDLLRKEIYNEKSLPASVHAPSPKSAQFASLGDQDLATQVILTLEDARSVYTAQGNLNAAFRLEGGNFIVTGVAIDKNKITLDFVRASGTTGNPSGLSFIGHDNQSAPILINERGIGLLHFHNLAIKPATPSTTKNCSDPYERISLFGTELKMNSSIKALISNPLDTDRFYFIGKNPNRGVKIDLTGLPADFDIYLYDPLGRLVGSSTNSGTTNESISLETVKKKTRYTIYVVGKNGAFHAKDCYSLKLNYIKEGKEEDDDDDLNSNANIASDPDKGSQLLPLFSIYPNPVQDRLMINWPAETAGTAELRIIDLNGRQVKAQRMAVQNGPNLLQMQVSGLTPGIYLLQVQQGKQVVTRKLTIAK